MFAAISNIFGYLLNFLYELLNSNFGFAIIVFSILLRLILLPITIKQQQSMKKTNKIQGQLKALQVKYKNNQEMLNKETMELYKREKISPFSGCLSAIIQIIIVLSVFYMVSEPLTYMKKADNSNPELKAVVDEYKEELKNENNSKTRYAEIATISKIKINLENINKKLADGDYIENEDTSSNENSDGEQEKIENTENNVQDNVSTENTENVENNSNAELVEQKQTKQELEKRKDILAKLNINMDFLGLDLSKVPTENLSDFKVYIIPILYVISSFISIKLTTNMQNKNKKSTEGKESETMDQMNKSMTYMMPIMAVSIACIAPLGLALYWFVSNALMIAERFIITKLIDNKEDEENA